MRNSLFVTAIVIGTAGATQAATLSVEVDHYLEYDATLSSSDSATVEGTLRVIGGSDFKPSTLTALGGVGINHPFNSSAPAGELNGDVYLDGGTIDVAEITVSSNAARLFVNSVTTASSVVGNGDVFVNDTLSVLGGEKTYISSTQTTVSANALLKAGSFTFTSAASSLEGDGTVDAGSFSFGGQGQLSPGVGSFVPGTLSLVSAGPIDLQDILLVLDFTPSDSDLVAVAGSVEGTAQVFPLGFSLLSEAEIVSHGPFVFLTATVMNAQFVCDASFLEIYKEDGITLAGHMVIETDATSAYFTFQPVPEPATLGVLSLGVLAMRRRRW